MSAEPKFIGNADTARCFITVTEILKGLAEVAVAEGGFTPGLLACFRSRAAGLVSEVLGLCPIAQPLELTPSIGSGLKTPVAAPTLNPEKPVQAPDGETPHAAKKPEVPHEMAPFHRHGMKLRPMDVHWILDQVELGKTDLQIAEEFDCSLATIYRLRIRSVNARGHWKAIDSWKRKRSATERTAGQKR